VRPPYLVTCYIPYIPYYYDKGKNASQPANKICAVYGPDTVSISTAQRWLERFRSGVEVVEGLPSEIPIKSSK